MTKKCKIVKIVNDITKEKKVPDWYKNEGNYSLMIDMLNKQKKYNPEETKLKKGKTSNTPDISKRSHSEKLFLFVIKKIIDSNEKVPYIILLSESTEGWKGIKNEIIKKQEAARNIKENLKKLFLNIKNTNNGKNINAELCEKIANKNHINDFLKPDEIFIITKIKNIKLIPCLKALNASKLT